MRGVDDDFVARGFTNIGAWILGRNMFGPVRGPWADDAWTGWWGDNPPYHTPVFVLTKYPRPSIAMSGGTIFHFATDGIQAASQRATEAANGRDVRLGGGVATIRQYLEARLIDEMHVGISPILLGSAEHLLAGIDTLALRYQCTEHVTTADVMHFILTKHPYVAAVMSFDWKFAGRAQRRSLLAEGAFRLGTLCLAIACDPHATTPSDLGARTFANVNTVTTHTCGLNPAGAAYCWGTAGIGDGTTTNRLTPAKVAQP